MNKTRGLGTGPRSKLGAWIHHHRQAAADSLQKMLSEPLSTFMTWLVVGIALALPTVLAVMLDNGSALAGEFESPARFSLLLEDTASLEAADDLADGLASRVDIESVTLVARDDALRSFAADTGLSALLDSLPENPLPHTLLVRPEASLTGARLEALVTALAAQPLVDEAVFDTRWLSRLEASLTFARRLVIGLGILMMVGAVLILGNTIRLAIEARREEIVVIKLIGGSDGFARRPFLYTGLWCGIGGGMLGAVLVLAFFMVVAPPIRELLALYDSPRGFSSLSLVGVLNLTLIGGALGLISAWQAASLHLKRVEPR